MKTLIPVICFFLLISCESKDEKTSRLTIDTYTNKLNLIIGSVVESRVEEGSQLSTDNLYSNSVSKLMEFINELNSYNITSDYLPYRDIQLSSAEILNNYIGYRKDAISSMNSIVSSYESANRIISDLNGYHKSAEEFAVSKNSYALSIQRMDSICISLDSMVIVYNQKLEDSRLVDKIFLPVSFRDTVNDWLVSNKSYYLDLQVHSPNL